MVFLSFILNISLAVNLWKTSLLLKMKQDCAENPELIQKVEETAVAGCLSVSEGTFRLILFNSTQKKINPNFQYSTSVKQCKKQ